ncbi:MAG: hypothetical protein ACK4S2_08405 [Gemmobacter sp.]|uniref:hypothetical protein n=1 Tax=Gemmobacter sp. TaxID=1898957 RepID=UPI00391AC187
MTRQKQTTRQAAHKAAHAAFAPLAYWTAPLAAPAPVRPDLTALDQMYAYFD